MWTNIRNGMNDVLTLETSQNMILKNNEKNNLNVLSMPILINTIETLCSKMVEENLDSNNLTSVGTKINIRQISMAPSGINIKAKAMVLNVDRNEITFKTDIWDKFDLICTGFHNRIIVNKKELENKAINKLKK